MTGHAPKSTPPTAPIPDAELSDERSTVREKVQEQSPPRSTAPQRLEHLYRRAKLCVADLPADDPHARLLKLAMTRRDETLLERLLDQCKQAKSVDGVGKPSTPPDQ